MKWLIMKIKLRIFSKYFVNIVRNLGIVTEKEGAAFENNLMEVQMALKKCKNHPSINAITERMKKLGNFLPVSISSHMSK